MTIWALVNGPTPIGFYPSSIKPATAPDISYDRLLSIGSIRWAAHVGGGDEAANCTLAFDNADGDLVADFASGLMAQSITIFTDDVEIFTGVITDISVGETIRPQIVADALSQYVALRRTTVWSAPFVDAVIPHVIGRQTIRPIRYSADGRQWLCADHACAGVLAVELDGKPVSANRLANTKDEVGHAIAVLNLNESVSDDQDLFVTVQGLLNSEGELAQNPAEVVEYLVSTIGGQGISAAELDGFRAQCAALPIKLNMLFDDDAVTYRSEIDRIMNNVGGIFSPGMQGIARIWPQADIPAGEPNWFELSGAEDFGEATARLDEVVTELTIDFDYEPAQDRYRQSITLRAQASEDIYGRRKRATPYQAGALQSRREAFQLGERLLPYLARARWKQSATISGADALEVSPGAFVNVTATHLPIAGQVIVTGVSRDYDSNSATIELEQPYGAAPSVRVVQSSQLAAAAEEATTIEYLDGTATITALAPDGSILTGATITLNGVSRVANAQGQARFVIDPGIYELRINADGYDEQIITDFRVGL